MPLIPPSWLLWSQAAAVDAPRGISTWLQWFYVWGEPGQTDARWFGGPMTWTKVIGLFCLIGWLASWVTAALKETRGDGRRGTAGPILGPIDIAGLLAIVAALGAALLQVMQGAGRAPVWQVGRFNPVAILGLSAFGVMAIWLEVKLWTAVRKLGTSTDVALLGVLHLALAFGFVISFMLRAEAQAIIAAMKVPMDVYMQQQVSLPETLMRGGRMAATYMGLVVLLRVVLLLLPEVLAVRPRRLYAIAWQCWVESFRRMWAPWVVIVVFGVILAFTSWFLQPPRPAEMGRLYVGTLMLLSSLLLTVLVMILAPISLPNDIRQQTIYAVVAKPVRRLELVWGRILGFMALVTVLLLLFGGISLLYFQRQIGGQIRETEAVAAKYAKENKVELAQKYRDQSEQLRTRMSARLPVRGSLTFIDSRGKARRKGIDVGMELEYRSFVEGSTQSKAIWRFGRSIPDPLNPTDRKIDRPVPVNDLLQAGTIEWFDNQSSDLKDQAAMAKAGRVSGDTTQLLAESRKMTQQADELRSRERSLRAAGNAKEADKLHSRPVELEMTFTVYRTTKGEIGEPVYASLKAINPRPGSTPFNDFFPVREYYTTKRILPSSILVGSHGELIVEVGCGTANQYLGMAEGDLYVLASKGGFNANYLKGLVGIWLQAMVLTAIGVCAGTFLSWPVALLMTIWFFVAGQAGFVYLQQFALQGLVGGGPFESLIRLLSHDNQMSDLDPTMGVIVAKTLDSIVMPVMSRLVFLVPNFAALDVSNTVASGFAVTPEQIGRDVLLGVGYALPFSIAGYFILKNREVAA